MNSSDTIDAQRFMTDDDMITNLAERIPDFIFIPILCKVEYAKINYKIKQLPWKLNKINFEFDNNL